MHVRVVDGVDRMNTTFQVNLIGVHIVHKVHAVHHFEKAPLILIADSELTHLIPGITLVLP